METILQKYEFRMIRLEETEQAAEIEQICFPPNEACSYEHMAARIKKAPDLFLVAVDRETGKLAGFLNGLATDREHLTDDFFTDASVHNPEGKNIMLLGLDVLPDHRGQGLARALVDEYLRREREKNRKLVILTCVEEKVNMYEKFGFHDHGIGESNCLTLVKEKTKGRYTVISPLLSYQGSIVRAIQLFTICYKPSQADRQSHQR